MKAFFSILFSPILRGFFSLLMIFFLINCGAHFEDKNGAIDFDDDPISFDDGNNENPTNDGTAYDPGEEDCTTFGTISISPSTIDFGVNEIAAVECQSITVGSCLKFSAELSGSSSTEFNLTNAEGTAVDGRLSNQENSAQVCYQRTAVGTHKGQVNVVIDNGASIYASVITLDGTTTPSLFNITQPLEGQLVWEYDGISSYSSVDKAFVLPTSGTINSELASIITSYDVTITIGSQTQTLDASSYTFASTLNVPEDPAVYPVTYSIPTTHGTLSKVVNVIRYYRPEATLEIHDTNGARVNSTETDVANQTDAATHTLGIIVDNLDVSGPSDSSPLEISVTITKEDGTILQYSGSSGWLTQDTAVDPISYYLGLNTDSSEGENGRCADDFDNIDFTYCVEMPTTADLGKGTNIIQATLCNDFTEKEGVCVTAETSMIVDNDLPQVTLSSPIENQVFGEETTITLTGTVENFVMTETSTDENGNTTEECLVKMWLNTSTDRDPISLCDYLTIIKTQDDNEAHGNQGNLRKASFSYPIDPTHTDSLGYNKLTRFTNLLHFKVQDNSNHVTYLTTSIQRGVVKKSSFQALASKTKKGYSRNADITSATMGTVASNGTTTDTPLMLTIGEGTFNGSNQSTKTMVAVTEKFLSDNLEIKDVITGGAMGEDENGNPQVVANSHGTAMEKVRALIELNLCNANPNYDKEICDTYKNLYNEEGGNNVIFFPPDYLADSCGNVQTVAVIFYDQLQYVAEDYVYPEHIYGKHNYDECDVYEQWDCPLGEWPREIAGTNLNFNDTSSGIWKINNLNFKSQSSSGKSGHFIDVDVSLEGQDGGPALWSHGVAYNLSTGGSSGQNEAGLDQANLEDPIIPVIFNIGRLKIKLEDAVEVKKIQLNDDGSEPYCKDGVQVSSYSSGAKPCDWDCQGGSCSNKVIIDSYQIQIKSEGNDIEIKAYQDCARLYRSLYGSEVKLPYGCSDTGEIEAVLVELNTKYGYDFWVASDYGNNKALLELIKEVLLGVFKNTVGCINNQAINPIIDPVAFPYHFSVSEDARINSLTMAVDKTDDGVTLALEEDAVNPIFSFTADLKNADLLIEDGSARVKLPSSLGASNARDLSTKENKEETRDAGFMSRGSTSDTTFEDSYPLAEVTDLPYFAFSLGLEEFLNAATHVMFAKGLSSLADLLSLDELEFPTLDKATFNKVIAGRFGICGNLDVASTDLAPSLLFSDFSYLFPSHETSLDIGVNRFEPPTIAVLPIDGDPDAALLEVGLSNIQIDVKSLNEIETNQYKIGDKVFTVRLDMTLKVVLKYIRDSRRLEVYILPYSETPIYLSVANRGVTYNDEQVIKELRDQVLKLIWPNFSKEFRTDGTENTPSIAILIPENISDFGDEEAVITENNMETSSVGECVEGEEPQYYSDNGSGSVIALTKRTTLSRKSQVALKTIAKTMATAAVTSLPKPSVIVADVKEITPEEDPCSYLPEGEVLDNDIKDALCDFGLQDISFGTGYPNIIVDYEHGYIHFSTSLNPTPYDALWEEVSTND